MLNPANLRQYITFGLVGLITVGIEAATFYVLWRLGMNAYSVALISFFAPAAFNYYAHCMVTFRAKPSLNNKARYAIAAAITTAIHMGTFSIAAGLAALAPPHAKIIAMAISILANFFIQKYFTFRSPPQTANRTG